jgi:hypothetical protein
MRRRERLVDVLGRGLVRASTVSLSRDDWIKIGVGFGAVVLAVVLNIVVREWYEPAVHYVTGGGYIQS